jgi:hypothetical protein
MTNIVLPEFDRKKRINSHHALVFSGPSRYDIILGRDFLLKIGMELNFKNNWMKWIDNTVLMKDATFWNEQGALGSRPKSNTSTHTTICSRACTSCNFQKGTQTPCQHWRTSPMRSNRMSGTHIHNTKKRWKSPMGICFPRLKQIIETSNLSFATNSRNTNQTSLLKTFHKA